MYSKVLKSALTLSKQQIVVKLPSNHGVERLNARKPTRVRVSIRVFNKNSSPCIRITRVLFYLFTTYRNVSAFRRSNKLRLKKISLALTTASRFPGHLPIYLKAFNHTTYYKLSHWRLKSGGFV